VTTLGLYVPGNSPLHRMPASAKLLLLVAAAIGSLFVTGPYAALAACALVLILYAVARIPWRVLLVQARPIAWFGVPLLAFHVIVNGGARAVAVVGMFVALILLAALVTLTTRVVDLTDVVVRGVRPLRRLGVDPERVGLLVALGIRAVPVMVTLAAEVRDARRARGGAGGPSAYLVPLVLRALRQADRVGEALVARGAGES